jgi:hypothetical protein
MYHYVMKSYDELKAEMEHRRLLKIESIVAKLKRGKNVQNRLFQAWFREDEHPQIKAE